jgi:hypothetical protein
MWFAAGGCTSRFGRFTGCSNAQTRTLTPDNRVPRGRTDGAFHNKFG